MKSRRNIYIVLVLSIAIFSCRKFVELNPPTTQLVTKSVFASDETATAALTSIYSSMCDNEFMPYTIPVFTGLLSDELTNYSSDNRNIEAYKNTLLATDAGTNVIWSLGYSYIYQANAVFEGCKSSTTLTAAVKKQLMAEALFIRAFWYTYLVNFYGDIPLTTSTDYKLNSTLIRTDKDKVYQQIIADLKVAESDLNDDYVDGTSKSTTTDRLRPNKISAAALLARVYLYHGEYANAEAQATIAISNGNYALVDPSQNFLADSKEAIWELSKPSPTTGVNTWEGYYFILENAPLLSFQNSSTISTALLKAFDSVDKRKVNWIGKYTDNTVTPNVDYYFPNKYKVFNSASTTENSIVLRLAEQYLIRAEARAQQNKLNGAIEDVDAIRNRAGLTLIQNVNPTISQPNLITEVLNQRRLELFGEWGHRWIDLKRSGTIDVIMSITSSVKSTTWNSTEQLWPIPQTEILNNTNLKQNPGYN